MLAWKLIEVVYQFDCAYCEYFMYTVFYFRFFSFTAKTLPCVCARWSAGGTVLAGVAWTFCHLFLATHSRVPALAPTDKSLALVDVNADPKGTGTRPTGATLFGKIHIYWHQKSWAWSLQQTFTLQAFLTLKPPVPIIFLFYIFY